MDYLLLELVEKLQASIDVAQGGGKPFPDLENLQALPAIQNFRELKATLRAKLVEKPEPRPEKESEDTTKTVEVKANPHAAETDGWQKIDMTNLSGGGSVVFKLPAIKGKENVRPLVALSREPAFGKADPQNDKWAPFMQVVPGEETKVTWQGGPLYVKYPVINDQYYLKIENQGKGGKCNKER